MVSTIFNEDEVKVIFLLGGPEAGKGTQCYRLVKNHSFVHLSAGDLLRREQDNPSSKVGTMIKEYIRDGMIVPMDFQQLDQAIKVNNETSGREVDNKKRFKTCVETLMPVDKVNSNRSVGKVYKQIKKQILNLI
ncbi:adenylate kinase isoenzyme 1 [Phakopsora pachyrhizi]|nr:adenylate kinase isoenzyme 1 [Phakopsora pachyrhizi]